MKKLLTMSVSLLSLVVLLACGGENENHEQDEHASSEMPKTEAKDASSYDPTRGEGKFNAENVKLEGLNEAMSAKGEAIAETKCFSCHKITDEKLVGPGWKAVTTRHEPYWIMNFITNPDPMIDKDPKVQAQLELCLVRMPNQNLSEEDARNILEFMRKNDGAK